MEQDHQKTFFGHPRGLATLFFTEMWERFSYYGMRALLVLFMMDAAKTGGLGMDSVFASSIYGLYTFSVYLLALPGGWVADRILGQRNAVLWGGVMIAIGELLMALPMVPTTFLGMGVIALGTGLLKPNVSAIVGALYKEDEGAKRDAGFSIFYMGINLGAFLAPLVCGWLGETINWRLGFLAAGIGMVLGLVQYVYGWKYLGSAGTLPEEVRPRIPDAVLRLAVGAVVVVLVVAGLWFATEQGWVSMTVAEVARGLGYAAGLVGVLFFLGIMTFANLSGVERGRVFVILMMFIGAAVFWGGFEQAGSSMNIFAKYLTDRHVGGWEMPASWFQSVNPVFIVCLAPVFGWLWLALRRMNPSMPLKFAYGLGLLACAFYVMRWAAFHAVGDAIVTVDEAAGQVVLQGGEMAGPQSASMAWLVAFYFLATCGELCLSPVGLSFVTKLSPKRFVGQMMGTWFLGAALGNLIAGIAGSEVETAPMAELFGIIAIAVLGVAVLFLLLYLPLKKMMGGVE